MRRLAPLVCVIALAAGAAQAKPKLPPCPPPAEQVFIAPMGQPFRSPAGAAYPVAAWFQAADADHDARLTRAEFVADADRFFATLDADRDGEITPDEVGRYEREIAPEIRLFAPRGFGRGVEDREARAARRKQPAYGAPMGAGRFGLINTPQPVISADEDFNRGITLDEFRAAAAQRFTIIDKAGAGALTLETLPQTPVQRAATECLPTQPARMRP